MTWNSLVGNRAGRICLRAAALSAALFVGTAALAAGLSETDFEYLATYQLKRDSALIVSLSPKEQARLHVLINDTKTQNDPVGQRRIVAEALEEFRSNQLWEKQNPGKLWDAKRK